MGFLTLKTAFVFNSLLEDKATLAELNKGESARISGIASDFLHRERFLELGFTNGATVTVLRKALFGDPVQFQVRGIRYALRKIDADKIKIKTNT